jgi:hypothetical protein
MRTVLRVVESVNSSERAGGSYLLNATLLKIKVQKGK